MFGLKSILQNTRIFAGEKASLCVQQSLRYFRRLDDKSIQQFGYKYTKHFTGGLLPRVSAEDYDAKLPLPLPKQAFNDNWSEKKATFGQNDYIDIFGDGNVHPVDLIKGPKWLVGFRGNELQRLLRRVKFEGDKIRMEDSGRMASIKKRIKYLYWRYNRKFGGKKK